jgi:outer membrane receptor protein involved in Fe transport
MPKQFHVRNSENLLHWPFFEVNYNGVVTGNPNLVRATIDNFDLKWEMFPSAGQTFSVNPFYKRFTNPVELIANPALDGALQFTYGNAAAAYNYGVELEARVTLSTFTKNKNGILNRFTVYSNYSYIQSEVNVGSLGGAVTDRPLQGQSPYVFNAGVNYSNPKKFFDITLNANRVGRRIAFVGTQDNFTIWENPRTILDASVSKTFKKKLIAKLTMGDILAQNLVFYQDLNKNGSYDEGKDIATFNYRYGFSTSFSLTYNF